MEFANPVQYFLPLLFFLILLEVVVSTLQQEHLYYWKDTLANISVGIGAALFNAVTKVITLAAFMFLFKWLQPYREHYFGYSALGWQWWVWVLCIIGDDFNFYWYHRFSHTVRFLWAAHIMHHSSNHFNLSTTLRNGWITFLYKPIFWLWLPALGFQPIMILTAISINTLYQLWLHTQKVPRLGLLEQIVNTPQLHQVHHASNIECLDKNHGGIFMIWDQLFGTYLDSKRAANRKFGVLSPPNSFHPWVIFTHEYRNIWRDMQKASSWADKLRYLFYPPGWSPDGSTKTAKQLQREWRQPEPDDQTENQVRIHLPKEASCTEAYIRSTD